MVPLQAKRLLEFGPGTHAQVARHTEFLLDDLENLLLVKLLGKTLNSGQSLATIAFCCETSG